MDLHFITQNKKAIAIKSQNDLKATPSNSHFIFAADTDDLPLIEDVIESYEKEQQEHQVAPFEDEDEEERAVSLV